MSKDSPTPAWNDPRFPSLGSHMRGPPSQMVEMPTANTDNINGSAVEGAFTQQNPQETTPTTPRPNTAPNVQPQPMHGMEHAAPTTSTFGTPSSALANQRPLPDAPFDPTAGSLPDSMETLQATLTTLTRGNSTRSNNSNGSKDVDMDESEDSSKSSGSKRNRKKKTQRFFCTGYPPCTLSFTRSEHLNRHIRKHTGERPFLCHCTRRFSRMDNLRQHAQTVHCNEEIPSDSLAATGTRYPRQPRNDRPRTANRPRAATTSGQPPGFRGHHRNVHSTSSIRSDVTSYSQQSTIGPHSRPRPPPLHMGSYGRPDSSPATWQTNSPGGTPTSATFSNGQNSPHWPPGVQSPLIGAYPRTASIYDGHRTPGRRLSTPSAGNSFPSSNLSPHPFGTPLFPNVVRSPTNSTAGMEHMGRQSITSELDNRRRTWHQGTTDPATLSRLQSVVNHPNHYAAGPIPEPQSILGSNAPPREQLPSISALLTASAEAPTSRPNSRRDTNQSMIDRERYYGQENAAMADRPNSYYQASPTVNQRPLSYHQPTMAERPNSYHQPSPTMAERPNSYHQPNTTMAERPTSYHQPSTTMADRPNSYHQPSHMVERTNTYHQPDTTMSDRPSWSQMSTAEPFPTMAERRQSYHQQGPTAADINNSRRQHRHSITETPHYSRPTTHYRSISSTTELNPLRQQRHSMVESRPLQTRDRPGSSLLNQQFNHLDIQGSPQGDAESWAADTTRAVQATAEQRSQANPPRVMFDQSALGPRSGPSSSYHQHTASAPDSLPRSNRRDGWYHGPNAYSQSHDNGFQRTSDNNFQRTSPEGSSSSEGAAPVTPQSATTGDYNHTVVRSNGYPEEPPRGIPLQHHPQPIHHYHTQSNGNEPSYTYGPTIYSPPPPSTQTLYQQIPKPPEQNYSNPINLLVAAADQVTVPTSP